MIISAATGTFAEAKQNLTKNTEMSKTDTYIGVADCHGIESFHLKEDTTTFDRSCRQMRAGANRQRHAVYFEVELDKPAFKIITGNLDSNEYGMALEWLKRLGEELKSLPDHEKSWELIPNPKLDPYS